MKAIQSCKKGKYIQSAKKDFWIYELGAGDFKIQQLPDEGYILERG